MTFKIISMVLSRWISYFLVHSLHSVFYPACIHVLCNNEAWFFLDGHLKPGHLQVFFWEQFKVCENHNSCLRKNWILLDSASHASTHRILLLFLSSSCSLILSKYGKLLLQSNWFLNFQNYSFGGRKFEHALKHGPKTGLSVVTLSWFIDSVRRNVRMQEASYAVKDVRENGLPLQVIDRVSHRSSNKSCLPAQEGSAHSSMTWEHHFQSAEKEAIRHSGSLLANNVIYIDSNVPNDLKKKVVDAAVREGATFMDQWFVGCRASHVVCEGPYIHRYVAHANNLVTPMWILKSVKENYTHRLVHLSSDLARHVAVALENVQMNVMEQDTGDQNVHPAVECIKDSLNCKNNRGLEERRKIVDMAKMGVRNRRSQHFQSRHMTIRSITLVTLLDSICWSVSEPASSACMFVDRHGKDDDESRASVSWSTPADKRDLDVSFNSFSRPLKESEKREIVFKHHFMTILFPIDRFGELGPSSRTFFSEGGFTCLQVLERIYNFYQENLTVEEVNVGIHTDSKHADSLRSLYASKEVANPGLLQFKRVDFLGSRRSFEALKRVSGETNANVYELMIRA